MFQVSLMDQNEYLILDAINCVLCYFAKIYKYDWMNSKIIFIAKCQFAFFELTYFQGIKGVLFLNFHVAFFMGVSLDDL